MRKMPFGKKLVALFTAAAMVVSYVPVMAASDVVVEEANAAMEEVMETEVEEALPITDESVSHDAVTGEEVEIATAVPKDELAGDVVTSVTSENEAVYAYSVVHNGLWVHSTPELTTSNHLFLLGYNQALPVTQTFENGTWVEVRIEYTAGSGKYYELGYIKNEPELVELRKEHPENWTRVDGQGYEGYVTAKSGLNVHSVAGIGYVSLGVLPYGASVPVVAISDNWIEIKYKNNKNQYVGGYVSSNYLDIKHNQAPTTPPEQPDEKSKKLVNKNVVAVTKDGSAINIHVSPSTESRVITTLANGYMVTGVSETSNWRKVMFYSNDELMYGYVYRPNTSLVKRNGTVKLTKKNFTLKRKKSVRLGISGVGRMQITRTKWLSKNPKIATVSQNGLVTGKKMGKAKIVAQYFYGNGDYKTYSTYVYVN